MKLLAQRFMLQIEDVYQEDPATHNVLPGNLVRSIDALNNYLGQAMNLYFHQAWSQSQGRQDFINKLPELQDFVAVTFPQLTSAQDIVAASNRFDIFDVLDSNNTTLLIEAWSSTHLADGLAGIDPFYIGTVTSPGMIFTNPILYLFPTTLTALASFTFTLRFIKLPVSQIDGTFFNVNGNEDCPFAIDHLQSIADIATKLYDEDDDKEDTQ